jgi:hypothetical protein
MSVLSKSLHPDEKIKAGKLGKNVFKAGLAVAAAFMLVSVWLGASRSDDWKRFLYAYVVGWSFIAAIPIAMLWLILLHHLTRSRWSTVVRRIAEAITGAFPIVWIAGLGFMIPVLAGNDNLFYWAHVSHVHADGVAAAAKLKAAIDAHTQLDAATLAALKEAVLNGDAIARLNPSIIHKLAWLNPTFFFFRYLAYGGIFIFISQYFARTSRKQDDSGDPNLSTKMRVVSGPSMILFAVTTCLVAFDVIMSLSPKWYSTIFGVTYWGSACVAGFATLGLFVIGIQRTGRLVHSINEEHYHDIGKWMFSFTFFWAYTAFSQFMLQWYGNMPEETVWYKYRLFGDWQWVSWAILIGYFAFPFVILMSRWTKRIVPALVFFCVWQLVFTWLNMYWMAMPSYDWTVAHHAIAGAEVTLEAGPLMGPIEYHHVGFSPLDITVWLSLCGALVAGIGRGLVGNLIPTKDPTLGLSLAHEQL